MKNIIAYIIIFISSIVILLVVFLFYQQLKPLPVYSTSQLTPINVNGVNYKTTGAIPPQDIADQKYLDETIQLSFLGTVVQNGFQISVVGQGVVTIKLLPPYDKNKQAAMKWLTANGFPDITQDGINFQNEQ